MPHILSVSYDVTLLNTRQLMPEACGYQVTSAEGYVGAIRKCRAGSYDLLIMGHSIPHADKQEIVLEVRKHCPIPVLALLRIGEPPLEGAAESIDAQNPRLLLDAVSRLLVRRAKRQLARLAAS